MDKLTTIYIHTETADEGSLAKSVVDHIVRRATIGSLVAWYPMEPGDGEQAIFVSDAPWRDIEDTGDTIIITLRQLHINTIITTAEVHDRRQR